MNQDAFDVEDSDYWRKLHKISYIKPFEKEHY